MEMADDHLTAGLPHWPAEARELPDSPTGLTPTGRALDGWLIALGAVYPFIAFGVLLGGGGRMGPAAFGPDVILVPALILVMSVVGIKAQGESVHWGSVAVFAGWVAIIVIGQLWVWVEAIASV